MITLLMQATMLALCVAVLALALIGWTRLVFTMGYREGVQSKPGTQAPGPLVSNPGKVGKTDTPATQSFMRIRRNWESDG